MMNAWTLALLVVASINGQETQRVMVVQGLFSEAQCLARVRQIRRELPRGHRVVAPVCLPQGWVT